MTDLLGNVLFLNVLLLIGGFGALYFGAEWLVRGAARIAAAMGTSPVVVGLTLVSLGTSAPELVVGIVATLKEDGGLLMGNVLGSNFANIGLILGATALISPLGVADRVVSRDVPIMILITFLVFPLVLDGRVDRGEGMIMLALLAVYVVFTFWTAEGEMGRIGEGVGDIGGAEAEREERRAGTVLLGNLGLVAAGAVGLALGGQAIVVGAESLAAEMGWSTELVGLTIVALGTSLPELVTSLVAAARRQADIAVGNIVGSNIFNITAVMGASALVSGYSVGESIRGAQLPAVLVLSVLVWPIAASARTVRRGEGLLLLAAYAGFMAWITIAD